MFMVWILDLFAIQIHTVHNMLMSMLFKSCVIKLFYLAEAVHIDSGIFPLPFCLPWMEKPVLFLKFFQLLYKNQQTEVGKWHEISGDPVSINPFLSMDQILLFFLGDLKPDSF